MEALALKQDGEDDELAEALAHRFRTIEKKSGWEIVRGTDADHLALLTLAGDESVGGFDQIFANVIVSHPRIRMKIETIRTRNV